MKRLKIILVLTLVFAFLGCKKDEGLNDEDKSKFLKSYGTLSEGADIKETGDGGFILLGTVQGASSTDLYLKKVDQFGNHQWSHSYDGPAGGTEEMASSVELLPNGNIAILGTTEENITLTTGGQSIIVSSTYLLLTDYIGNEIPGKSIVMNSIEVGTEITTGNNEIGFDLEITPNGNFLAVSEKEVIKFNKPYKTGIIRLVNNSTFTVSDSIIKEALPVDTLDKDGFDYSFRDVIVNGKGDIVFTGYRGSILAGGRSNRLLFGLWKIDLENPGISGPAFDLPYGQSGGSGNRVIENVNGDILIAGFNSENGKNQIQVFNFGTYYGTLSPKPTWEFKSANSPEEKAYDIVEVDDGYVLAGFSEINDDRQFYLVKINKTGTSVIWEKNYGFVSFDEARSIIRTSDNGLAVLGTSSDERGNRVMTLLKLDAGGNLR